MTTNQQAVQATISRMTAALDSADVEGVLSTYEPDAVVLFEPASPVSGSAILREQFEALIAVDPHFEFGAHEVIVAGDIALHLMPWTMKGTGPDGSTVEQSGLSAAVLRCQAEGHWLMVIDNPHAHHTMSEK